MEEQVRKEYFELLGFASVGADAGRFRECVDCASWWRRWLGRLGFEGDLLYPTRQEGDAALPPPPVLFAERKGDEGATTVLFYGHYDVQPADPEGEWKTPPFTPTVVGERVYCRGAQDDKGQSFAFLCGLRDFLAGTGPKPTVKILLEGQEESGSAALTAMLAPGDASGLARRVAADVLLVSDTSAAADLRPAIVAGLRGVAHLTIRLTGANRDLHSGEYGGVAPNPAQGMAALVASLHNPDGSIAVAGFRDGIEPPTHDELRLAEAGLPDENAYALDIGCEAAGGQLGKTIAQRLSFEPTVEVNGIHTGYGGPGVKTVIPGEAVAKLSLRLVPGQRPAAALAALKAHLDGNVPRGLKLTVEPGGEGSAGFRLPVASPIFRLAESVLAEMDPRGPVYQWDGASLPVLATIREASGAAPLVVGWGQPEDRIHAPNESYSFAQFARARDWARRILAAL